MDSAAQAETGVVVGDHGEEPRGHGRKQRPQGPPQPARTARRTAGGQVPGAPRLLRASLFLLFFSFLNFVTRRNLPLRLRLESSSITFCGGNERRESDPDAARPESHVSPRGRAAGGEGARSLLYSGVPLGF